jgi:predicted flap endonuclease-1-like 5' DNA nuclease
VLPGKKQQIREEKAMSITHIEGIGPAMAKKLEQAGIRGVATLLKQGATTKGRKEIAEKSGVSESQILKWVNMADLFRIKGIAGQYAELLEAAGVDTVRELATRNPQNLQKAMQDTNDEKSLVRQVPGAAAVTNWVGQAKELPRAVHY